MQPRVFLLFAALLVGVLSGLFQAEGSINVPVVAAPLMKECPEAKIVDIGVWDEAMRFEDEDIIVLRRRDMLFSYSIITGETKKVYSAPDLAHSRIVQGITWGKRQWIFCDGFASMPFAVDISDGERSEFSVPGVTPPKEEGPYFHDILNSSAGPGTIIGIEGGHANGWPRKEGRPAYFWMNLSSGDVLSFPIGWDLSYFSADQTKAVFESGTAPQFEYRPWATVNMDSGKIGGELPDRTKVMFSENRLVSVGIPNTPWKQRDYQRHVWPIGSPETPQKLLHPQVGRGDADSQFVGLSVDGTFHPQSIPQSHDMQLLCADAQTSGNLAIFLTPPPQGPGDTSIWAGTLDGKKGPAVIATNAEFKILGGQRCALVVNNQSTGPVKGILPEPMVYDAQSNTAWNVMDGVSLWTDVIQYFNGYVPPPKDHSIVLTSGIAPRVSTEMISGFGSASYPAKALCTCSTFDIPKTGRSAFQRANVLLTSNGERYRVNLQIHLPEDMINLPLPVSSWLHNSGKLVFGAYEHAPASSGYISTGRLHLYVADLGAGE